MKNIKIVCFIAIFIFFISNLLFATEHYIINTSSVILNQNFCFFYNQSNTYPGDGGVIFNNNGNITISSCTFVENKNLYQFGFGGAIYNNPNGDIVITSTLFNKNSAVELSTSYTVHYGMGGVIYNNGGKIIISSTVFSENQAQGNAVGSLGYNAMGGAIYNKGEIIISSTIICENIATAGTNKAGIANGGAISNSGKITLIDGVILKNNSVTGVNASGGAIFNSGIINLIANTGNIEFTGNTANGVSNAIHDNNGTINLWTSENASVIFNDKITSYGKSILNINQAYETLPTKGKIILNEDMSGYIGQINLYGGEIELQAKPNSSNINTNKFFIGNINLEGGTLNILNNAIDNIAISTLSILNANLKIDVNLSNNTSDNFTVTNNVTGEVNLRAINILGVYANSGNITLFNNKKSPTINIKTTGNYGGYEYVFSTSSIKGVLCYNKTGKIKTFKEVINDDKTSIRSYSLSNNENVTEDLGNLGGEQLTIFGNGYYIIGSKNFYGIYITNDKILNIEDVDNWRGFDNTYGAIKNEGTLNISGTNFSNNEGQDIINNGNLILANVSSSFEKGITGTGTTTISGININLANAVIEQNIIEIIGTGSLTLKAQNIVGNIKNNGNLIFTGGTNSNQITGTGITIIDGTVTNNSSIANLVTINQNKQLTTLATNINGNIENNGNLIFNGGTNNNIVTGTGLTQIYNNVTNQANITQNKLEILTNKQLINSTPTITINELLTINSNAKIINDGNLILTDGTNNGKIEQTINTSTTTINGNFTNNGIMQQKIFYIENSGNLINNNNITATEIQNKGTVESNAININGKIENNGNLIFDGGTNNNLITGAGNLIISGKVINNNIANQKILTITGLLNNSSNIETKKIIIKENGTINNTGIIKTTMLQIDKNIEFYIETSITNLTILENIENNGNLILTGGNNNNQITGEGTTTIDGIVINNSSIANLVTINQNKQLTTSATNIRKSIQNNGKLIFNDGSNNNQIKGIGTTIIDGTVTNNSSIKNLVTINQNKQLTTSAANIEGQIENNGNLIFNTGENKNYILGVGITKIDGSVTNNSIITNAVKINSLKQLTTNATNINGQIENNGKLIFNGGINNNIITGTGLTQIYDNVTNQANITQNDLEILANKQLTNSSNITITDLLTINNNAKVINNDKLLISSGTNNGSIDQTTSTSITTINGNFVNNGTIKQKELNIAETGKIINNNNINAKIINSGILILNSGTENNNEIMGNGNLYINCNLINNNSINQKEIEVNSNINMSSSLSNTEQKLNEFINNSEISAEKLKLKATMLKLTENGILKIDNVYSEQNSAMDLANNKIQEHNLKKISVTDNLNLSVDVDLANKQMDTITTDDYDGTGKININTINILTDIKQEKVSITFTTSTALKGNITSVNTANSRVFKYDVEYNKNLGNLIFSLTKDINFTVIESQLANSIGGFVTQTTIFNQAFASMENIKSRILQVKNKITDESLLYASTANTIFFQKTNRIESGLWLRPFYSQETINLDNLSIDNTLTGTLAGLDLATGEDSLLSLYLGYAGSEQKYENIKVSQTGYILGVTGMLVKEQWYAGLTANINFNKAESQSSYGTDNFDMNMYSIGAKAGYNYEINDKWTLEPNLMLMYGNVNSQEYQTTQGAKVEGQSIANIIFEPQVKVKLNLENGWYPYGLIGYVINAGDKVTTKVEEVEFDGKKIGNYVEFGAGVDKSFKNSPWSLYIQLTGRSGDRTGFDGNFGIKYSFLTAKEKKKISKIKKIQAKRKAKEEFEQEQRRIKQEREKARIEEQKRRQEERRKAEQELEIQKQIEQYY